MVRGIGFHLVCLEGVDGQYKKVAFGLLGVIDEFRIALHLAE